MSTTETISFTVTPELKSELEEAAKGEQTSLSEYIREAAKFYMKRRKYQRAQEIVAKRVTENGITVEDVEAEID